MRQAPGWRQGAVDLSRTPRHTCKEGPERRPEPLGEAERDRRAAGNEASRCDTESSHCVEQARAVAVQRQAVRCGCRREKRGGGSTARCRYAYQ